MPDLRRLMLLSVLSAVALLAASASASAAPETFTNPSEITIPASGTDGAGTPYPSSVVVSGMTGPITDVNVTLHRVGHTNPRDIGVLLVSPSGTAVNVMRLNCSSIAIEDFTWILDQQASTPMPQDGGVSCPEFVYRPNPFNGGDPWPAPAPAGPYGVSLNDFNGENANGTWRLYVADFSPIRTGDMEGGWTLTVTTGPVDVEIPGTGTSGPASPYPATRTISGHTGLISDLNVSIQGIWHQRPDDLDLLLVGPRGQKVILMSDACGSFEVAAFGWTWDDEAAAPMPNGDATNSCGTTFHRPADYEPGENWPTPAPAGPYSTSLSSFDGTDPNGEWRLFVTDDASDRVGFFTNRFQLHITTILRPDTTAPKVRRVVPAENATGISPAANVSAFFSEAMRSASINTNTVKLFKTGTTTPIAAVVSYDASTKKATLNPNAKLRLGTRYKAIVTAGARDLAGNQLDQDQNPSNGKQQKVWFFTVRN